MTFRVKKTANFCQISNEALRDTRLSYCARGILAMVLTHSDEWKTSTDWLRENTKSEGKVAIGNAIKELKEAGYLKITPLYVDGRFNGHVWSWSDAPQNDSDQNSRNRDSCDEDFRNRACVTEQHSTEHQEEEEKKADADASAPPRETSFHKGNPPAPHPLSSAAPPPSPLTRPAPKPRPRNALLETILEVTGVDWQKATKSQWACAAKALGEIKEVDPAVTPEALRAFAAQKRNDWDKISFGPMAIAKHWGTGPIPMRTPSSEPDPFDNKPTVTRAEVNAKFGYGADSVKWLNRLEAARRLVK